MKTMSVLIVAIAAQAAGNVSLTHGMKAAVGGTGQDLLSKVQHTLTSPYIYGGVALLLVFFILYSAALSWADLSFVLPATSFGYVVNVAGGHFVLHEPVATIRWVGAAIIVLGVVFVSSSGVREKRAREKKVEMDVPDREADFDAVRISPHLGRRIRWREEDL